MALDHILPSALRSATGDSGPIAVDPTQDIRADLVLTASNTPTSLNVFIEHSNDGGTTWVPLATLTLGAVATGAVSGHVPRPNSGLVRARWVIVGTSYTFAVLLRREGF